MGQLSLFTIILLPFDALPCIAVVALVVVLGISFIFSSKSNIVGMLYSLMRVEDVIQVVARLDPPEFLLYASDVKQS